MEYFAHYLGDGVVALVPYPSNLTPAELDAFMAAPPADVLETARRERAELFGFPAAAPDTPPADAPPAVAPPAAVPAPDVPFIGADDDTTADAGEN